MFRKKSVAVILCGLLMLALLASGGCLGDSGTSDTAKDKTLLATGEISKEDMETFKEKGVTVENYSKEGLYKSRRVLIPKLADLSEEQATDIKAMFDEDGNASVTLYEPDAEKIKKLKKLLDVENFAGLQEEGLTKDKDGNEDPDTQIVVYSVGKDSRGNILTHAQLKHGFHSRYHVLQRDDSIRKEDVDAGKVWVKYNSSNDIATPYDVIRYELSEEIPDTEGNYYEITKENVIGTVGADAVNIDDENKKITVTLNNQEYDCLYFNKGTKMYEVLRQGIELPEDEPTVIEITKEPLTAEEKKEQDAEARKSNIGNFTDWMFADKGDLKDKFADSGYMKPKTMTEKIVAWAKSTFGGKGVACAGDEKPELFDVATITESSIGETYSNLKGLMLCGTITTASAHHFSGDKEDGGDDYYFVKQNWAFNNGMKKIHKDGGYKYKGQVAAAFGESRTMATWNGDVDEFYLSRYEIHSSTENGITWPDVVSSNVAPEPYNKQTTTTVSHGWNVGANVQAGSGKMADKKTKNLGLSFSGGYQSSKSSSYQTYDIEVVSLNNAQNKIDWKYETKRLPEKKNTNDLSYPAELATSTYQPGQCFIWKIPTNKRGKYSSWLLETKVDVGVAGSYRKMSNFGKIERQNYNVHTAQYCLKTQKPALFCIDKETVNFNESPIIAQYVYVYSQGDWEWDKKTVPDWLEVVYTPSNGQLSLCPKPNHTGETRTAVIKLSRVVGSSTEEWENERTITVTQSPYSK